VRHVGRLTVVVIAVLAALAGTMMSLAYDREPPRLAHYSSEFPPRIGFILDRSSELAKLRFDGTEEILILRLQYAAGNDRLLLRDDGEVLLRISGLGGITLFTAENRRGVPVAPDSIQVAPLGAVAPPITFVREMAGRIMRQLQAETGREIVFEANWGHAAGDAGARGLLFDAIRNTGTALLLMTRIPQGRAGIINNLRGVRFMPGQLPSTYFQGNMLIVVFSVGHGMAGRPSSHAIQRQLRQIIR